MKVVKKPAIYQQEHKCLCCQAVFLIDESDVKVGKFSDDYRSPSYNRSYFECSFCGNHNILEDFPSWKSDRLKDE